MNTLVVRPTRVRTAGVRQQILLTAQQRLMILMLLFAAAFALVSMRLVYFALFDTSSGNRSGGSFEAGTSTVTFGGVSVSTITGSTTFYSFTSATAGLMILAFRCLNVS